MNNRCENGTRKQRRPVRMLHHFKKAQCLRLTCHHTCNFRKALNTKKIIPSPNILFPACLKDFLPNMMHIRPARIKTHMKTSILMAINSVVNVEPILVPRIIGMDFLKERMPVLTKPITMTINAELL